jgi:hypothetical protein
MDGEPMSPYDLDESVETVCGETGCDATINCGDAFLCPRCGEFFCERHMLVDTSMPEWTQVCEECDSEDTE